MIIASPMLVVALGIGLFIGVIQAATSINEMTLSFIPKLMAMGITLALFGGWQLSMLVDYTRDIYKRIPALFS
jgi:flagellar biosynthetic protein FliQ